jgi:hypothetical protein
MAGDCQRGSAKGVVGSWAADAPAAEAAPASITAKSRAIGRSLFIPLNVRAARLVVQADN